MAALSCSAVGQQDEKLGKLTFPTSCEQEVATLEEICLIPCAETEDLKRAMSVYNTLATR